MLTGFAGENRAWRLIAQRLMRPLVIVEAKPAADALLAPVWIRSFLLMCWGGPRSAKAGQPLR